jgi:hypothetical protein
MNYQLVTGDENWIVNTKDPSHNPVFKLAPTDRKHAHRLVENLNKTRAPRLSTVRALHPLVRKGRVRESAAPILSSETSAAAKARPGESFHRTARHARRPGENAVWISGLLVTWTSGVPFSHPVPGSSVSNQLGVDAGLGCGWSVPAYAAGGFRS